MSTDAMLMAITERHSANLGELATALAKAQAEIKTAAENASNPHFGSTYADLASVWDACREPLTKNGLSVVQQPCGDGEKVGVTTILLHASGQYMSSTVSVTPDRKGPQAAGSCITYLRRYSLSAYAGIAPKGEDDDGEGATDRTPPQRAQPSHPTAPRNDNAQGSARRGAPPQSRAVPPVASSPDQPTLKQQRRYRELATAIGLSGDEARARVCKFLGREVTGLQDMTSGEMDRLIVEIEAQQNASA